MGGGRRNLRALPKAELHIHLEGAMRPETLTELCLKHGVARPEDTRGHRFPNFGPFAATYIAVCECLRDEEDLFRLVREVAEDALASGALWIEAALSFSFYAERFGGMEATLRTLLRAAEVAENATGIAIGYIPAAERFFPAAEAENMARALRAVVDSDGGAMVNGRLGIVGFGLHADETGYPPEPFAKAFSIACSDGKVAALPHAGEMHPSPGKGPDSVRFCVEEMGAPRIAHGVLAMEDAELVASLVAKGVCLDVCPTSNYLLSIYDDWKDHPLPQLIKVGVPCTINSDDPLLFGSSLLGEFEACRHKLGLDDEALAACARNSFLHSRAPEALKQKGVAGVDDWLAHSRSRLEPTIVQPVIVVDAPGLTITEHFGRVASLDLSVSVATAVVKRPMEVNFSCPEFAEYVVCTEGSIDFVCGNGSRTHIKAGQGVYLPKGLRVKWTWPEAARYMVICLPAFTPDLCGTEDVAIKSTTTAQWRNRLQDLHNRVELHEHLIASSTTTCGSCFSWLRRPSVAASLKPLVVKAVDVVNGPALCITEHFGRVACNDATCSVACAVVKALAA